MNHPAFFGYGSLVNLATHRYDDPKPAQLHGWRRQWHGTHLRKAAYLSVTRCPKTVLQGVVAGVPDGDWAQLDKSEAAYDRHDVSDAINHAGTFGPTAVYQVQQAHLSPRGDHPILLSYVDVVVQGYLKLFGPAGVAHFFETTDGWDAPVLNDRAAPIYPRHQNLSPQETALVDHHLAAVMEQAE